MIQQNIIYLAGEGLTVKAWASLIWISIIIFQDILDTLCRLSKTLQRS